MAKLNLLSENYVKISKIVGKSTKLTESRIKEHYHDVLNGFDELKSKIDGVELKDTPDIINFRNTDAVRYLSNTDKLLDGLYPDMKILGGKTEYSLDEAAALAKIYSMISENSMDDLDSMNELFGDFEVKLVNENFTVAMNASGRVNFSKKIGELKTHLEESQVAHDLFYKTNTKKLYKDFLNKRILIKEFIEIL